MQIYLTLLQKFYNSRNIMSVIDSCRSNLKFQKFFYLKLRFVNIKFKFSSKNMQTFIGLPVPLCDEFKKQWSNRFCIKKNNKNDPMRWYCIYRAISFLFVETAFRKKKQNVSSRSSQSTLWQLICLLQNEIRRTRFFNLTIYVCTPSKLL